MLEFKEEPKYESLLQMRTTEPARFERLAQSERDGVESYESLKREQTRTKRPLRRRYFTAEEKADYIRNHGQENYLALPF